MRWRKSRIGCVFFMIVRVWNVDAARLMWRLRRNVECKHSNVLLRSLRIAAFLSVGLYWRNAKSRVLLPEEKMENGK